LEGTIGLGAMGRPADPMLRDMALRALQGQLSSRDRVLALWSHVSLMSLDKVTDAGLGAVVKELRNPDLQVRIQAAQALGAMGTHARVCSPNLVSMLQDREPAVAAAACSALVSVGASNAR